MGGDGVLYRFGDVNLGFNAVCWFSVVFVNFVSLWFDVCGQL